ncbi:CAF1-domain-containing protein [Ramicandelaber brevisporus]|nr:CAF1-domain-containing protein [Ramicandelaber brevisporus]
MIREVWADNLELEMEQIRQMVNKYPYIAMDTEFPGVVVKPIGPFKNNADYTFQTLRANVDVLKLIQLGITFADSDGNLAPGTCTWQFNFKFDLDSDMYAPSSIELLTNSGIDFKQHERKGIDPSKFGELLTSSGLVLIESVNWISFHSTYDFGYLLKLLTGEVIPKDESGFFEQLRTYFPRFYDIKHLMRSCKSLKGGLQEVANDLNVPRIGQQHQAGSDSILTMSTFFKMQQLFFEDRIDDDRHLGILYGLNSHVAAAAASVIATSSNAGYSSSPSPSSAASLVTASSTAAAAMSASSAPSTDKQQSDSSQVE